MRKTIEAAVRGHVIRTLAATGIIAGALAVTPVAAQQAPTKGPEVWDFLAGLSKDKRLVAMEREATREGQFTIYGALGIDRANILIKRFNDRYPKIKVEFVRLREPELVDKVLLEHRTGRVNSDLALSSVPWLGLLAPALDPYETASWEEFDPRFRFGSRKDRWTAIVYELLPQTIAWRTDRVKAEEAPKTLHSVLDSKWKGRTGTTTHLESLIDGLIEVMGEAKAMELVRGLAGVEPRLYRSTAALSDAFAAGEFDVAFNFSAHRPDLLKKKGVPVDYVFQDPLFGVGITFSVVKGAEHPYSAALFMDYLTEADSQEMLDKSEGGRFFGHLKGRFTNDLKKYPGLSPFKPISTEKFSEFNKRAEQLFIRK